MAKISLLLLLVVMVVQTGSLAETEVPQRAGPFSPNQAVDFILDHLSQIVVQKKSEIHLRDLKENFTTKVSFLTTDGVFVATDGCISKLSSYERTGDAVLKRDGKTSILSADFGLDGFALVYENYKVSSEGVCQRGQINARTANNTFSLQVDVTQKGYFMFNKCTTTLTAMSSAIGSYQMEITNLGIFKNVEKDIYLWVESEMRRYAHEILTTYLKEAVEAAKLCENLKVN